ncbi:fungal-specific transcription factor domain-containing protein [Nemania sp. NC0429]|nr:fungal-specific transcription factor domain-containing protein [Nemania sp. NC0429]
MPFKRTRTGCLTCRRDGYKCDEQKPFCGRCVRLGKECTGYGLQLRWQSPTKPQKDGKAPKEGTRRRRASPASFSRRPPRYPAVSVSPRAMSSGIPSQYAYLLHHWSTNLASLITMSPTPANQFHTHITPMAEGSPSLSAAICFMAARHLSVLKADSSLLNISTQLQTQAIGTLRNTIHTENPLISLAVVVVLQITDQLFTTDSGVNHLKGAKYIIEQAGPEIMNCDAGVFLTSVCLYHDAVISVSKRTPPILGIRDDIPFLEEMKPIGSLKILWEIIGEISSMSNQDSRLFDIQGANIERNLRTLDTCASHEGDAGHTIHAYKEAAYIYLHRVWHNVGSPHPSTLKHARDCLNHLFEVPVSSPLVSAHALPLWTAACETIDATLRDLVRKRVRAMYELRHLPSLQRLEQDIEDVWDIKDRERTATGIDKVDCIRAILAIRQRGADLV